MPTDSPLALIATAGGPDIVLAPGSISIGRDRANTIVLPDPSVPARAVRIDGAADGWYLAPVDASVVVNGIAISEPTRLLRGDKVRIGRHLFTVTAHGARPSPPRPRPSGSTAPPSIAPSPQPRAPEVAIDGELELAVARGHRPGTLARSPQPELELASLPRPARASFPPVAPPPDRTRAYDDARAKMAWGHPIDDVRRCLVAGGYTRDEIRSLIADMVREEHALTRGKGLRQVGGAALAILGGVLLSAIFGRLRVGSIRFGVVALLLVVGGAIGLLHGLLRLLLGGRERHDIAG